VGHQFEGEPQGSKKAAEQSAAEVALAKLQVKLAPDPRHNDTVNYKGLLTSLTKGEAKFTTHVLGASHPIVYRSSVSFDAAPAQQKIAAKKEGKSKVKRKAKSTTSPTTTTTRAPPMTPTNVIPAAAGKPKLKSRQQTWRPQLAVKGGDGDRQESTRSLPSNTITAPLAITSTAITTLYMCVCVHK
jgi:hypothetical protein